MFVDRPGRDADPFSNRSGRKALRRKTKTFVLAGREFIPDGCRSRGVFKAHAAIPADLATGDHP